MHNFIQYFRDLVILIDGMFSKIPLPLTEIWGVVGFTIGSAFAIAAFGGLRFNVRGRWGIAREGYRLDNRFIISMVLTFLLMAAGKYLGHHILLVPGAQSLESLFDLAVFLCAVLFGYPAILTIPAAYFLLDAIGGFPLNDLVSWIPGHLLIGGYHWLGYILIGRDPDFCKGRTWRRYILFVLIFLAFYPACWGFICGPFSGVFPADISYTRITPSIFMTFMLTWLLAPFFMLIAYPLARKVGLFWADIDNHVTIRERGSREIIWQSGPDRPALVDSEGAAGWSARFFFGAPVVLLVLATFGAVSYITLNSGEEAVARLALKLQTLEASIVTQSLDRLAAAGNRPGGDLPPEAVVQSILEEWRAIYREENRQVFIIDRNGHPLFGSAIPAGISDQDLPLVTQEAMQALHHQVPDLRQLKAALSYRFELVTATPLTRQSWLARVAAYPGQPDWLIVVLNEKSSFIEGIYKGGSRSAMIISILIILVLLLVMALSEALTKPLANLFLAAKTLADGNLLQPISPSRITELNQLGKSFADMAEQLARHQGQLEELVSSRTNDLLDAKERAEIANRTKSIFLANMSHELRTPLNAILGFSEMMAADPNATGGQQEKLAIINRSGEHLLAMINDVLEISKIEAGRAEPEAEAFDLPQMLKDIGRMFELRAGKAQLNFELQLDPQLAQTVKADLGRLRQILINLLANAVSFTGKGDIALRARTIPVDADPAMVLLQLEVEDSGPGIPAGQLQRIFEPFVRLGNFSTSTNGTGLGLAISRSLAEVMGGGIMVESTPGKGSLFSVELPLALAKAAEASPAGAARRTVVGLAAGHTAWRILVVEDIPENRLLLSSLLLQAGFEIREAENGEQGVALFEQWQPHFIWMDMRMPVMDGYRATAKIRQLPGGDRVKIVAITASAFREQRKSILEAGCNEVVRKPFQAHEIFDCLEQQLGVCYRYAEQGAEKGEEEERAPIESAALGKLPVDLLRRLSGSARELDIEAVMDQIDEVAAHDPELAVILGRYVKRFELNLVYRVLNDFCEDQGKVKND
ncbi:ATP-binding protein [Desulfogranum mediterraneum]|uniref:ATP-binding protein n=1 Tax=Desulfogranum mediterraneum TaxID=160661 RepID=UPI0004221653|nr:ATP-binding protein [Desulfogranum mediterraneum]